MQINLWDKLLEVEELGQMLSFFIGIVKMFPWWLYQFTAYLHQQSETVYFPTVAQTAVDYQVLFNFAHLIGEN